MDDPVPEEKPVSRWELVRLGLFFLGIVSIGVAVLWSAE